MPAIPHKYPPIMVIDMFINNSTQADHVSANNPCVALNMSMLPLEVPIYIESTNNIRMSCERMYSLPSHKLIKGSIKWYMVKHRKPAIKCRIVVSSQKTLIMLSLYPSAIRLPILASMLPRTDENSCPILVVIIV